MDRFVWLMLYVALIVGVPVGLGVRLTQLIVGAIRGRGFSRAVGRPAALGWAVGFGLATFVGAGIISIGILVLPVAVIVCGIVAWRCRAFPEGAIGSSLGTGTVLLIIGLMNSDSHSAVHGASWLPLAAVLIVVAFVSQAMVERRTTPPILPTQMRGTLCLLLLAASAAKAQQLSPAERARIDSAANAVLAGTGAPSASVAVVRQGQIVLEQAYGTGRIDPQPTPATTGMRYAIGSNSKQFTSTAVLLLAEEGKLSLDDKVSKWFPKLTRANEISIRQLLTMTSGYQDYWPQDYVFPDMLVPATVETITQRWAGKALDFEPGSKWQYSNTNFVIAAAIVQKVSGVPLMTFLQRRIFTPLSMTTVMDFDASPLTKTDAEPLLRNGLGPLREAPKEARGWLFGAGGLAMTASDLARWDIGMMNQKILKPASYREQQRDMLLNNGVDTRYGMGVGVQLSRGRRMIEHNGAVSGYTSENMIYPDDKAAIVVFTNIYPGAAGAPTQIANRIASIIFEPTLDPADTAAASQARRIYDGLVAGKLDRSLFTPAANAYFTQQVIDDYATSLSKLGAPTEFSAGGQSLRGGMTIRSYRIRAGGVVLSLTTMTLPDGKIDQYIVERAG
jgi:CubicO group peptidase (beta-lactamase class C family)